MLISIGCKNTLNREYQENIAIPDISPYDFASLLVVAYHEKKFALYPIQFFKITKEFKHTKMIFFSSFRHIE